MLAAVTPIELNAGEIRVTFVLPPFCASPSASMNPDPGVKVRLSGLVYPLALYDHAALLGVPPVELFTVVQAALAALKLSESMV